MNSLPIPKIRTLEEFYSECGKVFDRHKIRIHDRMFIVSVGMIVCFNAQTHSGNLDIIISEVRRFLSGHLPEAGDCEIGILLRKSDCLTQSLMSELIPVLLRTALDLGDYTGGWFNEAGGVEADGYFPTPPDVVHLIRKLILTNFPARRIPFGTKVFDPTCGTGSMLLPFMEPGVHVYGQEKDGETFLACLANLHWKNMDALLRRQEKPWEKAFQSLKKVVLAS